ncbi:hypothetical protein OH786_33040 [Streptomyces atratus]|jgi:hypothetical protein|uniref:GAF domain-containing protein n=1 Tax=Streptomyces atratus TaxID=1893 RepID=A0A1K2DBF3_STRAR|nr:GAF domain-containing protein [Streptomyces atratus]SFY19944.1 hypothetical protein SAMN02787144_101364 [Streptomyces atratus]
MPENSTENQSDNWSTALRYIAGRKAAEESLGFLAHISSAIRETADLKSVIPAVARASVPFFASAISLDASSTHSGPVVQSPTDFSAALEGMRTLAAKSDQRQLVISEHEGFAKQTDPVHLEQLHEWKINSAVALSLDYRGVSGGRLVLVRDSTQRRGAFGPGDLALASELADRVAAFNVLAAYLTADNDR